MSKHWIQGAIKHPGALTRKAKAAGETVAHFLAHPPKNMSSTTAHEVALAKTLRKMHHPK